jgi:putative FmdB family regulatory protein
MICGVANPQIRDKPRFPLLAKAQGNGLNVECMPTYQYVCAKCDQQFEVFQAITEPALSVCPKDKCRQKRWGRGRVRRLLSGGAGFLFKGSGFYVTDYRSEGYRQAAKKETETASPKKEASNAGKADTPKTEAKPAKPKAEST